MHKKKECMMMKNRILYSLITCVFMTISVCAQSPYLSWVNILQGPVSPDDNITSASVLDQNGNLYTTGYFMGTVDFDNDAGYYPLTSAGNYDCYVTKVGPNGNFIWAKRIGGTAADVFANNSIAIDNQNNIFITGSFQNTVDFDPGVGVYQLFSNSADHGFVCKWNANGDFIWARSLEGGPNGPPAIAETNNGELVLAGYFSNTVDFDMNSGVNNLSSTSGSLDGYVYKIDTAGNFVWAQQFSGAGSCSNSYVEVDGFGNIYVTGTYLNGSTDLNPGSGTYIVTNTSSTIPKAFVLKLNSLSGFQWAQFASGSTGRSFAPVMTVNASNELYISSTYQTSIFSVTSSASPPYSNLYFAKVNTTSGGITWIKNIGGGATDDLGQPFITCDSNSNLYIAAVFTGTIDLNPGTGTYNLSQPSPNVDGLLAKFDSNGDFLWAGQIGKNSSDEELYSISANNSGDVYFGGLFATTCDFDPSPNNTGITTATSGVHSFICKWSTCPIPEIFVNPSSATTCEGDVTGFSVTGNIPNLIYQWQVNTGSGFTNVINGSNYNNATSSLLWVLNAQNSMDGNLYRCIISNPCGADTSAVVSLTVVALPVITTNVIQQTTCEGSSVQFSISATGDNIGFQWYENNNPVSDGGIYSGAGTSILTLSNVASSTFSVNTYYCFVFNTCSNLFSDTVGMTIHALPMINTSSTSSLICSGETTTLTASGATSYTWSTTDNTTSIVQSPTTTTTYTVNGTDANGCSSSSMITQNVSLCTSIVEALSIKEEIKIYPNPNNGTFIITIPLIGIYNIINSIGQTVQVIDVKENTQKMDVKGLSQGVYYILGKNAKAKIIVSK